MSGHDVDLVRRFIDLAWNRGDGVAANLLLGPGFRHHDLVTHTETDASGYLASILRLRSAFTTIELVIRDIFATEGHVASQWTAVGTHGATATDVEVEGISIDHIHASRFVENWTAWDILGLRQKVHGLLAEEDSVWPDTKDA